MACSLRARGADYSTIAATLSAINANRCSPQLEHTEIDGIVKRACRYALGAAASHVNGEVHAELDTFALAVFGAEWRGKAGKTDRDVLLALIGYAPRPAATGLCATTCRRRACGLRRYNRHSNALRWLAEEP